MVGTNTITAEPTEATVSLQESNGSIHLPARVQAIQNLQYDDEVEVEIETPKAPTDSVTFTAYVNSGYNVTVPAKIRRMCDMTHGKRTVYIEATGNVWTPDVGGRKDYLNESDESEEVEIAEEKEGLHDLFG